MTTDSVAAPVLTDADHGLADELEAEARKPRPGDCLGLQCLLIKSAEAIRKLFDLAIRLDVDLVRAKRERNEAVQAQADAESRASTAEGRLNGPPGEPVRRRLPDERQSLTRRWVLHEPPRAKACPSCHHRWEAKETADVKVYAIVGMYPDGSPGELFLTADSAGSLARGALDAAAICISIGLQHGVPLGVYLDKLVATRYGPGGWTGDKEFPQASSVLDLVARWLRSKFVKDD